MFVGQFQFTLDIKKRLIIPSKFRTFFPEEEKERGVYVSVNAVKQNNNVTNFLSIYPFPAWQKHTESLTNAALKNEEARLYLLKIATDTEFCNVDAQWRIVVPVRLINTAGLKRDIMITGVIDHMRVWDMEKWREIESWLKENSTDLEKYTYPIS
jgi:MraZ protein